jgi:elongation factor P
MNTETFDQIPMNKNRVGDMALYLKENEACQVLTYGEEAISVELPAAVVLEVVETEPGLKGDTAQGATKPAKMETGLVVTVPLFINTGDKLKVDTRTGAYLERST